MRDFRELKSWVKAHKIALDIYTATRSFPKEKRYGLTSQLRRAALSVPTNIAEGCGRGTDSEFAQFSKIAAGSASEVEYLLQMANELRYLDSSQYKILAKGVVEVKKMLNALILSLRRHT